MNLNTLARRVSQREGKKVQVNIAQIKEVIRCLLDVAAEQDFFLQKIKVESFERGVRPYIAWEKKARGRK